MRIFLIVVCLAVIVLSTCMLVTKAHSETCYTYCVQHSVYGDCIREAEQCN